MWVSFTKKKSFEITSEQLFARHLPHLNTIYMVIVIVVCVPANHNSLMALYLLSLKIKNAEAENY